MKKIPQDIVGDIAILKFKKFTPWILKKLRARTFLKENPSIRTVLEKKEGFSGDLRIQKTKWVYGIKTNIAHYRENDCIFTFDINETYFSPRLSNERKLMAQEICKLIKKNKKCNILVMFAGVAPFPIVIGKTLKRENKDSIIYSNELNSNANKYAKDNIFNNKLENKIFLVPGDANKLPDKIKTKFDIILMPRPNIHDTFLKPALKLSKKGTIIFYHGFGTKEEVLNEIKRDSNNKIGNVEIRKAGDIGPYVYRWLAKFKVL